jgi:hypothetical protein
MLSGEETTEGGNTKSDSRVIKEFDTFPILSASRNRLENITINQNILNLQYFFHSSAFSSLQLTKD